MKSLLCTVCRRIVGYQTKDPEGQEAIIKNTNYSRCDMCGAPICRTCSKDGLCERCRQN